MQPISSLQNPRVKAIRSLSEKKFRQDSGLFIAEGDDVLARARAEGWTADTLVTTEASDEPNAFHVTGEVMAALSAQRNPPRRLGVFRQKWTAKIEPSGLWPVLAEIRDPGNLGSIIRTADAAGAAGLILAGTCCDPWAGECVRASMGSIFGVPLARLTLKQTADLARTWPGEVVGTHLSATEDYRRDYGDPCLLLMGSESSGLTEELVSACSVTVRIPMMPGPESLNVAAAAALMLYEARRKKL